MSELREIESFGGIDADTDELLDACFSDHEAYLAALNHDRYLLVGRKGSGKTAIYRKLLRTHSHNFFSFGHTFKDYPWHFHDQQKRNGVPEEECYSHSWKYLILITLAKILLNQDGSQPWDDYASQSLSSIESFVIDTYGSRDPDVTQVFQPANTLKLNANLGINIAGVSVGASPRLVPMADLPLVAQEVNNNLMTRIVGSLNPDNQYFVLFDELDLGFAKADENYYIRLMGLIIAARDINNYARENGKNLNVVIFLRDDIYLRLNFEDKNKITENGLALITWDTQQTTHTLKEIMERRFSELLSVDRENAWELIFDEEKEMRGHQTKYQHIIDRTMLRPRDMIKFCNEVLSKYRHEPSPDGKFDNAHVNSARPNYSEYLFAELEDEMHKHIEGFDNVFELLRDLQAVTFDLDEFEEICSARSDIVPNGYTARQILQELFEFSVVGYYQPGGAGYGGSEYVFRYKAPRSRFNGSATGFQVHLGLQEVLALKRYRRS